MHKRLPLTINKTHSAIRIIFHYCISQSRHISYFILSTAHVLHSNFSLKLLLEFSKLLIVVKAQLLISHVLKVSALHTHIPEFPVPLHKQYALLAISETAILCLL